MILSEREETGTQYTAVGTVFWKLPTEIRAVEPFRVSPSVDSP
jgi:hypothetical protein